MVMMGDFNLNFTEYMLCHLSVRKEDIYKVFLSGLKIAHTRPIKNPFPQSLAATYRSLAGWL
jgi:hypothetical protein